MQGVDLILETSNLFPNNFQVTSKLFPNDWNFCNITIQNNILFAYIWTEQCT